MVKGIKFNSALFFHEPKIWWEKNLPVKKQPWWVVALVLVKDAFYEKRKLKSQHQKLYHKGFVKISKEDLVCDVVLEISFQNIKANAICRPNFLYLVSWSRENGGFSAPCFYRPNYNFTKVASFIALLTGKWRFILALPPLI